MHTYREEMTDLLINEKNITDPKVIKAMRQVDRADFILDHMIAYAYDDTSLPIGYDQVISQPYLVAYMTEKLKLKPNDIVLEIGTGSGYNAAVISKIVSHVYSFEIIEPLAQWAKENLKNAGIKNVTTIIGDGYEGLPEKAPFDAIIFTAAPPAIPEPLKQQLKIGGRLIVPMGNFTQHLILLEKTSLNVLCFSKSLKQVISAVG